MKSLPLLPLLACLAAPGGLALAAEPAAAVLKGLDAAYPGLDALYRDLHQTPELSLQEEKTAAKLAELGFEVTPKVGGHGAVALLRNGKGPTVMLRTDLDGLPVDAKAAGETLPSAHSPLYAPDRERTLRTGVTLLTTAALELLGRP